VTRRGSGNLFAPTVGRRRLYRCGAEGISRDRWTAAAIFGAGVSPSHRGSASDRHIRAGPGAPRAARAAEARTCPDGRVDGDDAIAALVVAWTLRGEAGYALASGEPADVGDLALFAPGTPHENRYVRGVGSLASTGAIKYGRAAEGDSFRLAPIAGNEKIWVEIRVPEGFEGPRFIPPSAFAGRLVPFERSGLRHASLSGAVEERGGARVPEGSWILVDGTSPRASRWALALATLFVGFALWNTVSAARLVARVRDETDEERDAE
jgi:hypothetical protein